jgi:hypothetical protein
LRGQLYPSYARFGTLPFIVVQCKLSTRRSSLPLLDDKGINMALGSKGYSVLLVPFHGERLPSYTRPNGEESDGPFADPPSTSAAPCPELNEVITALDSPAPEYIFANTTLPHFVGWEDLTDPAWVEHITRVLRSDGAHPDLISAFEKDVIPGTVGAWKIVSCGSNAVPFGGCGGRVVLIGDAAHAMPPQG